MFVWRRTGSLYNNAIIKIKIVDKLDYMARVKMTVGEYLNEFLIDKFLIINKISNIRHIWKHLDTYVSIWKFYFLAKFRELLLKPSYYIIFRLSRSL